ncbi:MAG: dockerin type I repeat-containing protein [Anaerorhabdus sp.]|uniref:dockerin type I repeat-containing protein n=1 Tax=Anaerorhabdus sp. TaxID=1872524 RepID=UPI003A8B52C5
MEIEESEYLPFIFEGEDIPSKPPLDIANEITLTTSSANGAITEWMLKGDVTRDGVVNKDDVEAIQKHEASLKPILNSIELESADMNGDGYVDLEDAIQIEAVNNGVLLLPHASFTFRVVNTPNTGHEVTAVTVNGMNLTVPAKGTNVTTGAYTVTVDTMGVTTVEGIVQDYVNEVVFDNTPIVHNEITLTTSSTNGVITNWVLKGDVNRDGDGRLTASDANWIMRITTGLVVLPQPLCTVNVVNAPNVGYETSGVTISEVYYVAPAKGNSVTVDTYTITVDDNGNAAVEGIIQDYVNEIVFDNKVILPVVTPAPLPSTSTQTPEQGRTCQDDGYPAEYYWNGVACVIDTIVVVPPVVNQNPSRNQNGNEITSEEENFMPPVIDTVIETPKATVPEVEEKAEVVLPEETPLVKLGGWSLANLIITISSVILAILLLVMKKQKEETEDNATKYYQKNKYWIVLAVLCTILLIIVFFLTQDLRLPMIFVDNYTVIMVIIIIFNLPIYLLANQWKEVKSRT